MTLPNPKPFASLSSGLLARKGQARPAMRPQGFVDMSPESLEDLGWNDMGDVASSAASEPVPTGLTPAPMPPTEPVQSPAVLRDRERLAERFEHDSESIDRAPDQTPPVVEPAAAPSSVEHSISLNTAKRIRRETGTKRRKAAFTLRLDTDRHLRLRLASAIRGDSAQTLVTRALDRFLDDLPEVDALVRQLDDGRGN
ncbi:hypothetical protein KY084_01690 [Stakelama sp. CBK3Z-3]|uniref:Stability/partitioning determinant n=1 Tax=Stakelama flava TaxID=2860338 RepID=A0ABS6XH99_9SPHN|nr:hypothetical protein [Stakelama flava]MBW4329587.1 hypothetical protein [Stakelama flava]